MSLNELFRPLASPRWTDSTIVIGGILALMLIAELVVRGWMVDAEIDGDAPTISSRPTTRIVISKFPRRPPPAAPAEAGVVLLVGNSHTYTLPGLKEGDPLRPDPGATLLDELGRNFDEWQRQLPEAARRSVMIYRLSQPNFLPVEMLVHFAALRYHGLRPNIVVQGMTYRNIARGAQLRYEIREFLGDDGFREWLFARLSDAGASDDLIRAVKTEVALLDGSSGTESLVSHADAFNASINDAVGPYVTLVGKSSEIRQRIYQRLNHEIFTPFQTVLSRGGYNYDVIEDDLKLNLAALEVFIRWLAADEITLLAYSAPERNDLPPLIDPRNKVKVMTALQEAIENQGGVFADATDVVPAEFWGWVEQAPDRSHFTEPGHQRLGAFIVREGERRGAWNALKRSPHSPIQTRSVD